MPKELKLYRKTAKGEEFRMRYYSMIAFEKLINRMKCFYKDVIPQIEKMHIQGYNNMNMLGINHDGPVEFLKTWMEGDWGALRNEWPNYELPTFLDTKCEE